MGNIREKIDAANKAFVESFNRGDLYDAMNVYTEDATILPPNAEIMKGRDNITAFWQGAMNMGVKRADVETLELLEMGEDRVCEIGKYELEIQPEGAGSITDKGKYLMIWNRVNGSWKWDIDAWSSNLPAQ